MNKNIFQPLDLDKITFFIGGKQKSMVMGKQNSFAHLRNVSI